MRLSIDIGGTFTDVVLEHDGALTTTKVLTTYDDPASGVMMGVDHVLAQTGAAARDIMLVLHGTTLATNALIERRGAMTGLLTTAGHRDVLEMAFENRFEQYDVNIDRPVPLVPRHLRLGVDERVAVDGTVLRAMSDDEVTGVVGGMVESGVTALAVGFLHSYANPDHERRVREIVETSFPDLNVSLSSDVCPEIREYERLSTTVANAYVKPLMATYLTSLQEQLNDRGIDCQVLLMTSGGGLTTLQTASEYPIRLVESGPAGGAMLAADIARRHGCEEVLSFDMGGTTAKICLIDDGQPLHSRAFEVDRSYRFKKGSGLPVRIPVIEMVEIGAGGGSLAHVDGMKRLHVGPESAGSEPGPACYGRGGEGAAVTDADVVLGKLIAESFAGGQMMLDVEASETAINAAVSGPLQLNLDESAHAIAEIVEENMASAARSHASEWGKLIADRVMIAFGGAAPLHAADLAERLKINEIIVPAGAGVGSALGFLLSPVSFEVVRSYYSKLEALDFGHLEDVFTDMRDEASRVMHQANVTEFTEERQAYMRYVGQGYEVAVTVPDDTDENALKEGFERAYTELYGRIIPNMEIEILSWTLALKGPVPDSLGSDEDVVTDISAGTQTYFHEGKRYEASIVPRDQVETGGHEGPALIVERQTTTVVPPGWTCRCLKDGSLKLTRGDVDG